MASNPASVQPVEIVDAIQVVMRSDASYVFKAVDETIYLPPTPDTAVICVIHVTIWRSLMSSTDICSTPRVDFPIATGVTLSPSAAFAELALPVIIDSGSMVASLPCAAERLARFRTVGLEVLSVLRVGMVEVVPRKSTDERICSAVSRKLRKPPVKFANWQGVRRCQRH